MESIRLTYAVAGGDLTMAGEASSQVKQTLRKLALDADTIRRVSVCMYEGEINMVIHANGGSADLIVNPDSVDIILADTGPGIPNVELAMKEGYSTAPDNIRSLGFGAGMGLPNMKRYSDEMHIDTEVGRGTTVTMRVSVK